MDGDPVLAADTIVEVDGEILGKPVDADDARRMLGRLSGRSHRVHTGVAVRRGERVEVEVVTTIVTFVALTAESIDWYLATGEPFDKAGAYAIQGARRRVRRGDPGQREQRRRPAPRHRGPSPTRPSECLRPSECPTCGRCTPSTPMASNTRMGGR